ncbi:heavy metal translocating P-type ATPase [Agrilactobacillus composti]|nr:heavy metal translocating P-type ATPase [Agrilactobacillus composti]
MHITMFYHKYNQQILWFTGILTGLGLILSHNDLLGSISAGLLIMSGVVGAIPVITRALSALRYKTISIELLVTIAVIGAFVVQAYHEAAIVTFLFLLGDFLQAKTLTKTRRAIQQLSDLAPTTANVKATDGQLISVPIDQLKPGTIVAVSAGDQIPVDGTVTKGQGYATEAAITGEANYISKAVGSSVYAGTLLKDGLLEIETQVVGSESTFGKIIDLVESAQDNQSATGDFIDHFAKYYTPAVLILGIIVFLWTGNLNLAITLLVLGCPGALVIGAPVALVAGIGSAAKQGILIKGGSVTAKLAKTDTLIFDKTGTLTMGQPAVVKAITYQVPDNKMLKIIYNVERHSNHPLSQAVGNYLQKQYQLATELKGDPQVEVVPGSGLAIENGTILVGSQRLLQRYNVTITPQQSANIQDLSAAGQTLVLIASQGQLILALGINDQLRPEVPETLQQLRHLGIKHLVMLTGDHQASAETMAMGLDLDEIHGGLLPQDKLTWLKQYQQAGHIVAFVGDGINDSPALAQANVGIAMGNGAAVALETADMTLLQSSFTSLGRAVALSRRIHANTVQNISIAVITVAILLSGLLFGLVDMGIGMFVHEASILIVIANAMRLLRIKRATTSATQVSKVTENNDLGGI